MGTFNTRRVMGGVGGVGAAAPPHWVPPAGRHLFDPSQYAVLALAEKSAKRFVCAWHYSRSYPAAVFRVGLWRVRERKLVGVAVFGVPMNGRVVPKWTGYDRDQGCELSRLVLLDGVGFNGETWFLARCTQMLRTHKPHIRAVVSMADPMERTDLEGRVVKRAHHGGIYRAFNARLVGRSSPRSHWMTSSGEFVPLRTLSKIRIGEKGQRAGVAMLQSFGAPPPLPQESGAAYVTRALGQEGLFRKVRHPGNLVFVWGTCRRATRRIDKHIIESRAP